MNKKGLLGVLIMLVIMLILLVLVVYPTYWEYKYRKAYNEFCDSKPTFCYCSFSGCSFKPSYSSVSGFSKDTIELCELAKKLNDKKTIFEMGCE